MLLSRVVLTCDRCSCSADTASVLPAWGFSSHVSAGFCCPLLLAWWPVVGNVGLFCMGSIRSVPSTIYVAHSLVCAEGCHACVRLHIRAAARWCYCGQGQRTKGLWFATSLLSGDFERQTKFHIGDPFLVQSRITIRPIAHAYCVAMYVWALLVWRMSYMTCCFFEDLKQPRDADLGEGITTAR